jgi:hypothetical protein
MLLEDPVSATCLKVYRANATDVKDFKVVVPFSLPPGAAARARYTVHRGRAIGGLEVFGY